MKSRVKGNIQALNKTDLEDIKIPVPPLPEQKTLIAKIENLEQKITQAQITIKNAPQQKQQILDKYLK